MKLEAKDFPDVEMELVESSQSRSIEYDPDNLEINEPRRPLGVATETASNNGVITQRIRVSAISDLKEFAGKDHDEDRAR